MQVGEREGRWRVEGGEGKERKEDKNGEKCRQRENYIFRQSTSHSVRKTKGKATEETEDV